MKILVDENIPRSAVDALRVLGHDVKDIRGTSEQGLTDMVLWDLAQNEGRLLITTDKGFVRRKGTLHSGIVVVILRQPNRSKIHERVLLAVDEFSEEEFIGSVVVMRDTVRSIW